MPAHGVHELELPRSDGDQKSWPHVAEPDDPRRDHYVMTDLDEETSIQWRTKIGARIAKHLRLPDGPKYILKGWPDGYMLFVHHRGSRRDKYLYGRMNVRYRSAAEFIPHAEWLCTVEQLAPVCECRYCPHDKHDTRSAQGGKGHRNADDARGSVQSHLPAKNLHRRASAKSTPCVFSRGTTSRRSRSNPSTLSSASKNTFGYPSDPSPDNGTQTVLAYVRVVVPKSRPSPGGNPPVVVPWAGVYELVWCKLQHPIVWTDSVIDFWPGIIKMSPEGSEDYSVTLLGSTRDVSVSLGDMVPYRAFQVDEGIFRQLQPGRKQARVTLLDLEGYAGVEMDDNRISTITSALSFAISFSVHLATVWSWAINAGTVGSEPTKPIRYALRSQVGREERYDILWWGPERIEERQLVKLKMSPGAMFADSSSSSTPAFAAYPAGSDQPIFLRIHSIFNCRKAPREREHLTGPVVAGAIFDLIDESQYDKRQHQDLPPPPRGKVFRPLLKESYEIVLPITAIGGRYYWGIAEENVQRSTPGPLRSTDSECGKNSSIKPTTFRATRVKMIEHAYEKSREQTRRVPGGERQHSRITKLAE